MDIIPTTSIGLLKTISSKNMFMPQAHVVFQVVAYTNATLCRQRGATVTGVTFTFIVLRHAGRTPVKRSYAVVDNACKNDHELPQTSNATSLYDEMNLKS